MRAPFDPFPMEKCIGILHTPLRSTTFLQLECIVLSLSIMINEKSSLVDLSQNFCLDPCMNVGDGICGKGHKFVTT